MWAASCYLVSHRLIVLPLAFCAAFEAHSCTDNRLFMQMKDDLANAKYESREPKRLSHWYTFGLLP